MIIGAAFLVGVMRIVRRVGSVYMRAISSPDDYFSLMLLTVWFAFAFFAVPNATANGEWHLLTYFMHDGVLPGLRAVQQDLALPVLPVHPLLPGQDHGPPRGLPPQAPVLGRT